MIALKEIDECACPAELYPFLAKLKADTGCVYQSIYRGEDATALLHRLGKSTQAEIYYEYEHGEEPNPANPPGRSTHELKSDGVPYPGPIGRDLLWWQCGLDVDDAHVAAVEQRAGELGWHIERPYPSGSEYHHLNFTRQPVMPFTSLRRNDSGARVALLNLRLSILGYRTHRHSDFFDAWTHMAVLLFQRNNHLAADGVVGDRTWVALKNAAEHWKTYPHKHH